MAVTASTTVPAPLDRVVVTFADEESIRHVTHRADADGTRIVRTEIAVGALPVSGSATQTLTPQGGSTDVHVHCTVQANIPIVGKRVAEAAEPFAGKALSLQSREAEAWLAKR